MIEKAETTLGIPSPTELSAQVEEEQRQHGEGSATPTQVVFSLHPIAEHLSSESSGEGQEEAGQDGPSAVGGALGVLSSLSSVVQTTVSLLRKQEVALHPSPSESASVAGKDGDKWRSGRSGVHR